MKKIVVPLAEGFEEIEAVSIIDVLRRANFDVIIISITGEKEVFGAHNIKIVADKLFEEIDFPQIDMIILPGGMPGTNNLRNHGGLREKILNFNDQNKALGAICAAPMVFGELGILKNKDVTCYPGFEEFLRGAIVTNLPVETCGNIITGKGAGVAIDFALKITELFKGEKFAKELKEKMIVSEHHI